MLSCIEDMLVPGAVVLCFPVRVRFSRDGNEWRVADIRIQVELLDTNFFTESKLSVQ